MGPAVAGSGAEPMIDNGSHFLDRVPGMPLPRRSTRIAALAAALLGASVLAGCGDGSSGSGTADDPLQVVASFYPLQWMAQQVGGERVEVSSLTAPGAEPHDLELTPRDVGSIQDAAAVVYLSDFQPNVDEAVGEARGPVLDARDATEFLPAGGHHDEEEDAGDDHDHVDDPHFWLDPTKLAEVGLAFADTLADADPDHAADYRANARELADQLSELDGELQSGLADCAQPDLVTSHEAFGYLAARYGFEQVGITGLAPDADPSAKDVAQVADFVREHGVTTIYFETLTSPAVARTLASETGAATAVLDPLEGLTDQSDGDDYPSVMRSNLATLRQGQECS